MVDLAAKMDAVTMQDGSTLLDSSLLLFTQEAGQLTHHSGCVNFPLVTFGRAGGAMNTGLFVDFSDKSIIYDDLDELIAQNPAFQRESPGLYYNQFLHNALCALGVAPEHILSSGWIPARCAPIPAHVGARLRERTSRWGAGHRAGCVEEHRSPVS